MTSVVVRGWEIVASSVDGTVRRFDVRLGRMYVDELHHPITCVSASHDGLCLLAACLDSALRLLDKATGQLLASYHGHVHQSVKMDCCFMPSDAHVVGSSETGEGCGVELRQTFGRRPRGPPKHVAVLCAAAGDVLFWDLVEAHVVHTLEAHPGLVCSLAVHPQGNQMLTSSLDGVVKVWQPEPPRG